MKLRVKVRFKGGPGSGNWGHAGRSGKVGGSAPGGGFGHIGAFQGLDVEEIRRMSALTRAERTKAVKDAAEKFGFDPDKVRYGGKGYDFSVGDHVGLEAAGDYNRISDKVTFYEGAFEEKYIKVFDSVASHEFMHHAWQRFRDRLVEDNTELKKIFDKERAEGLDWRDSIIRPNGDFRNPEDAKRFPAYAFSQRWLQGGDRYKKLIEKDGVTEYSKYYWENYNKKNDLFRWDRAVNETLAEMSTIRLKGGSSPAYRQASTYWKSFYKEFMELASEQGYGITIP